MASIPEEQSISLQLGDIIQITSPTDDNLNAKQFFIKYLDKQRIEIVESDGDTKTLLLNEDGSFQNESIESIAILSRADSLVMQDNMVFYPDNGSIFILAVTYLQSASNITALDEDQIEILYLDNANGKILEGETIYIDFAYKGIPEDIPIKCCIKEPQDINLPGQKKKSFLLWTMRHKLHPK